MGDGVSKSEQIAQPAVEARTEAQSSVATTSLEVQSAAEALQAPVQGLAPKSGSADLPQSAPRGSSIPPSNFWRQIGRGALLGLTATASATIGALVAFMMPMSPTVAPAQSEEPQETAWRPSFNYQITQPVNILVMGIDLPLDLPENRPSDHSPNNVFAGRSDTMLLVRLDPSQNTVNLLSIPRDTQVYIPDEGMEKINYANAAGGPEMAAKVVSSTLNGVTIDRYVRVSTGAFRELVDLLGGVRVFVPERMEYTDNTQKLKIDLQPGWQTLNGAEAEQFARFRHDSNGDIGRVQRQQQLIRALREQLTSPALVTRIPQIVQLFQKYIDTNLSFEEMLALANMGLNLQKDNFHMVMLPGRFSTPDEYIASYWLMDNTGRDQVMQEYFDVGALTVSSAQHDRADLKIAVQNASSDPNLGSKVAAFLQSKGFDQVYVIEDWPDRLDETQIIAQRGDLNSASDMGTILGMGQVVSASTGDLQSDLTIRVGDDWAKRSGI
ncbi:LCP family protein [Leptolyngbya ohadii]|uniref:LCP family protein n=1 Tax=Leptolyngbya ohadii TaxID=1962290 RepID=UPI000B5A09CB|nr:LCP family protein [Leptolyngbya ohadii]